MSDPNRRFVDFKARALEAEVPFSAYLELTYDCTYRCRFCYNPRRHDLDPLSLNCWRDVLDDLRHLGTLFVCLTGGEPLLHQDFFEIASAVRERHMALRIMTNGGLVDDRMADALVDLRPFMVEMSLHGASETVHDATTSSPGSFLALWRAADALVARDVPVLLKTPLTRLNEGEIEEICALVKAHGIYHRVDGYLTPTDSGNCAPLEFQASSDSVATLTKLLRHVGEDPEVSRSPGGTNCGLGRMTVAIDPEGWVFPCIQWRHSTMGSVRQTPLINLWPGSVVRKKAAAVAHEVNDWLLGLGEPDASKHYCPAEVLLRTGNPFEAGR